MRGRAFIAACCLAAICAMPCLAQAARLKVAFVLLGSADDQGWNHAHHVGIEELRKQLGDQITVSVTENVGAAEAESAFRQYAMDGYGMIFGTSYEHMEAMFKVAQDFPAVAFEHCSGFKTAPNMGTYMVRIEQGEYLAGYLTGLMGYALVGTVATHPLPELIRGINGFTHGLTRGLRESGTGFDPDNVNTVAWLMSWRDPAGETATSQALIARGCTLIRQMAGSPDACRAACAKGVPTLGYGTDAAGFGAPCVLASTVWNWGAFYVKLVRARLAGTWKPEELYWGFEQDAIRLSDFKALVPERVRRKVSAEEALMKKGEDNSFLGPMARQDGQVMIPVGRRATVRELYTMRWFLKGVNGTLTE